MIFLEKLSREEVLKVANLAKIHLTEEEIEKFRVQLKMIMDSVNKIEDIKGSDEKLLISPFSNDATLREDEVKEMLDYKRVIAGVPKASGNFVEVPVMLNE